MNIKKAIEILELNLNENSSTMPGDCYDALSLSVEALKRIQYQRTMVAPINQPPLKGETKD